MKTNILLIGLIIVIVAFSGCVEPPFSCPTDAKVCPDDSTVGRDSTNNCEFHPCPEISSDYYSNLTIDILIPKEQYEVGESFSGEYAMVYDGTPFKGIVVYRESREGFEEHSFYFTRGLVKNIDFENGKTNFLKVALTAFNNNESFYEEGTYIYTMSVYDCPTVELESGKPCGEVTKDDILSITPLKSKSKSVVVSGGQSPSECKIDDDCPQLCEGCDDGKQICMFPAELCSDCFMDSMCIKGYKCIDYICVPE